ncbi:unnamed protein product [Urochloa humidicola]
MAELLLNDHCWLGGMHPGTADRRDVFTVRAWCSDPSLIPPAMELEIVEPVVTTGEHQPGKRTLVYPVSISVPHDHTRRGPAAPPPPADGDDEQRRQRRRRSVPSEVAPLPPANAPRASVHARLGPLPGTDEHVGPRQRTDSSSASHPCVASAAAEGIQEGAAAPTSEGDSRDEHEVAEPPPTAGPFEAACMRAQEMRHAALDCSVEELRDPVPLESLRPQQSVDHLDLCVQSKEVSGPFSPRAQEQTN